MRARRRFASTVLAGIFVAAFAAISTGGGSPAVTIASKPVAVVNTTDSALTKSGTGVFKNLKVTVGQTRNLIDQVVGITWTGAAQTQPESAFGVNYLQIMQCWGDAAAGPTADQCEFGGDAAFDQRGGNWVTTRQLSYGELLDPLWGTQGVGPLPEPQAGSSTVFEPFTSVTGTKTYENATEFYDSTTSNEVPFARTRGDGGGQQYFETQTGQEAPGLGCGMADKQGKRHGCWLVVVPRNNVEVDGTIVGASITNELESSPLSPTNWAQRIVFPLDFAPVGNNCPIGAAEHHTVGVEDVDEAFTRWQPALCANGGPIFGFSQVTDGVATRQVLSDPPGMAFVNTPIPAGQVSPDRPVTYAPLTLSGLTISFLIESESAANAPEAIKAHDGERISSINLTPRLVTKLLTQSYQLGVNPTARYLDANPVGLTQDPDFLAINPQFKALSFTTPIADMLVPESLSETTALLWKWIAEDPDAAAFLSGQPDPWGMRINPFYQGMDPNRQDFPKVDPYCQTFTTGPAPLCTLDAHPYAQDMHNAARAASRGDTLAHSAWNPNSLPPAYGKAALQLTGRRGIIALADTATSARFGLTPANLENASGHFVAPTNQSLLLGEQAMIPSGTPGVLASNPATKAPGAYPLVQLTYGVTAPIALTAVEAKDFANLIRYGVGAGQSPGNNPGQLPIGYVPLPQTLRTQALFSALLVQSRVGGSPAPSNPTGAGNPDTGNGSTGAGSTDLGDGSSDTGTGGDGSGTGATADLPANPVVKGKAVSTTGGSNDNAAGPTLASAAARTPDDKTGAVRYILPITLSLGAVAAAGGPALPLARRRIRR
jgi:hypothetical protein